MALMQQAELADIKTQLDALLKQREQSIEVHLARATAVYEVP
jgi:hypothetical protein